MPQHLHRTRFAASGESFDLCTANTEDGAQVNIRASGFLDCGTGAFFDIRVFHPSAPSYRKKEPSAIYRLHENTVVDMFIQLMCCQLDLCLLCDCVCDNLFCSFICCHL